MTGGSIYYLVENTPGSYRRVDARVFDTLEAAGEAANLANFWRSSGEFVRIMSEVRKPPAEPATETKP